MNGRLRRRATERAAGTGTDADGRASVDPAQRPPPGAPVAAARAAIAAVAVAIAAVAVGVPVTSSADDSDAAGLATGAPGFTASARQTLTHDDNLTRTGAPGAAVTDTIADTRVEGALHLRSSLQRYDASVAATRSFYQHASVLDNTALDATVQAASSVGRDGDIAVSFGEQQFLLPLNNFQALVRDQVTARNASVVARYDIGSRWRLELDGAHSTLANGNPDYTFNDTQDNRLTVGLSAASPAGSRAGLRLAVEGVRFEQPLTTTSAVLAAPGPGLGANGGGLYDPSYLEHRIEPFVTWVVRQGTRVDAGISRVDRSYAHQGGQSVLSTLGHLGLEQDDGARLTGGLQIGRELGGIAYLASRQVESDTFNAHLRYSLTPATDLESRIELARRRYSLDQPGFSAQREYDKVVRLGARVTVTRTVSLALAVTGDWRRANPEPYSYSDHRAELQVRYQP